MATEFMKRRVAKLQAEMAGAETVTYYEFQEASRAGYTGTVNEATAYGSAGVALPALIDFSPSDSVRKRMGEVKFEATLMIALDHLTPHGITLKNGDAFDVPGHDNKFYVRKVVPTHQVDDSFLVRLVAISHTSGRP